MIDRSAFFDELQKMASFEDEHGIRDSKNGDSKITSDKLKRLARYGAAGAAGIGLGYATGKLIGRPIQKKVLQWGGGPMASKLVRYGVPTSAALGAALLVAKKRMSEELMKKVKG